MQAYTAKQFEAAAACFAVLAARPDLPAAAASSALLMEARSRLSLGESAKAETALNASLEANPREPEALYLLGAVLEGRNEPKGSLQIFTKAAALRKPTGEELRIIALDYVLLGSYTDALRWLDRAVEFSPADAEAWYDLGRARMHEERFAEAATALQQSLALRPDSAKTEDNLGVCLEAENLPDAASKAYTRALKLSELEAYPGEQPFVDYGAFLNTQRSFRTAADLLKRATQLKPEDSRAYAELSHAYSGMGDVSDALSAMERAVALDAKNPRLHFQLGHLYRAAGKETSARYEFDQSSKLYRIKSVQ